MEKLIKYINSVPEPERQKIARACKTSVGYLRKAASSGQKFGAALCVRLEMNTPLTRQELRPDDWREIWPELKEQNR